MFENYYKYLICIIKLKIAFWAILGAKIQIFVARLAHNIVMGDFELFSNNVPSKLLCVCWFIPLYHQSILFRMTVFRDFPEMLFRVFRKNGNQPKKSDDEKWG